MAHNHRHYGAYDVYQGRQQGRNSLHEPYVKEAIRELKYVVECRICTEMIENKHFLKHVKDCAQKFNASFYKEEMIDSLFRASRFSTNQSLALLREKMEIAYFEATLDKGKMTMLHCTLCPTLQYHLDGGCIEDNQREAFKEAGGQIVQKQLSHFWEACHHEMQVGLQEIEDSFEDTTKDLFDEPSLSPLMDLQRIEILAEIDRNNAKEIQKQKDKYTAKKTEETRRQCNQFRDLAYKMYLHYWEEMVEYIKTNKNEKNLAKILEIRKRNSLQNSINREEKPKKVRKNKKTVIDSMGLDSMSLLRVTNFTL